MSCRNIIGRYIRGIHYIDTDVGYYSRYFITLDNGETHEVTRDDIAQALLPDGAHRYNDEYIETVNNHHIMEVRRDELALAIKLADGHILVLTSTYDGETCGNDLDLQDPTEAIQWKDEYGRMILLAG